MRIRSLTLEDLDLFVEAAGFPDHRKEVEQYMKSMFAAGSMRPEWCFVAEDERDRRAAQEFFEDAERVQHDPSWWRLAYAPNGELVGLVMPAEPPGFLTLFYVGVVPEMRGKGYVDDLLVVGTATLLEARGENHKPLIADTDVANSPMAAAFEGAGWTRFAGRREYVVSMPVNPGRHAGSRTTGWA